MRNSRRNKPNTETLEERMCLIFETNVYTIVDNFAIMYSKGNAPWNTGMGYPFKEPLESPSKKVILEGVTYWVYTHKPTILNHYKIGFVYEELLILVEEEMVLKTIKMIEDPAIPTNNGMDLKDWLE